MPVSRVSRKPAESGESGCVEAYCPGKRHLPQAALPPLRPAGGAPKTPRASASGEPPMPRRDYVLSSGIPSLLDAVTAALLHDRPTDPVEYMITWLSMERKREAARLEEMRNEVEATEETVGEEAGDESCRSSLSSGTLESDVFSHSEITHMS